MNKILILTKILKKAGNGKISEKNNTSRKVGIVLELILAIAFAYLLFIAGGYLATVQDTMGGIEGIFNAVFLIGGIIALITSFTKVISSMYMSSDIETLVTLPFSDLQILLSKFIEIAISAIKYIGVVILSFAIGYGIESNQGAIFYVATILAVILIPIFVLSAISIIIMLIMKVFKVVRNKNLLRVIGAIIIMALYAAYMVFVNGNEDLGNAMLGLMNIISQISYIIPIVPSLTHLMVSGDIVSILLTLVISISTFMLFVLFGKMLYLSTAINMHNTSESNKVIDNHTLNKTSKKKNAVWSYTIKEMKMIVRNPAYLTTWITSIVWPFIIMAPEIIKMVNEGGIGGITAYLQNLAVVPKEFIFIALYGISILVTFLAVNLSPMAQSSISREGKSFIFMKQVAMSYSDQIKAKRNAALIFAMFGSTIYLLICAIVVIILKICDPLTVLFILLAHLTFLYITCDIKTMTSLINPNIVWESEKEALRVGTLKTFLISFAILLVMVLIIGITYLLGIVLGLSLPIVMISEIAILILLSMLANKALCKYAEKKLSSMSV